MNGRSAYSQSVSEAAREAEADVFRSGMEDTVRNSPNRVVLLDTALRPFIYSKGWLAEQVSPAVSELPALVSCFTGDDLAEAARRCRDTGQQQVINLEVPASGQRPQRWLEMFIHVWPDQGPCQALIAAARDVTAIAMATRDAEAARASLAEHVTRLDAALDNMRHGIAMFDAQDRLILCNEKFRRFYGLPAVLSRSGTTTEALRDFLVQSGCRAKAPDGTFTSMLSGVLEDGSLPDVGLADGRTIRVSRNAISSGGFVTTHEDVSEMVRAAAQIEALAFRDSLTGLPNRAAFQLAYDEAVASADNSGEAIGVIVIDVDHFKDINDTFGHDAGDALLKTLAKRLKRAFRATDTVARLGGDEFVVILRGLAEEGDLTRPIGVLQDSLQKPIVHADQSFAISASIGAVFHNDPDGDATHLLKNADLALYQAKLERGACVLFEPAMRTEIEQRVELLREVRLAIAQDEFDMYYQPVVDLQSKAVVSFEALMRWNHPDHGVLSPAAFMAAFDDHDIALQLGDVAFERSLRQMRKWLDDGVEFGRVAVNVSSAQFRAGNLAKDVQEKLARWGVPAERLTIEVTENVYMGWGADIVSECIRDLHDAGVLIALDDFGTGYASLAHLQQFPIDRLKIDKSFVQNTLNDAIVRAVINLGSSMGMKVVAEGVESQDQLETLTAHGCDQVQGYHYGRPMPAGEIQAFIDRFQG